MFELRLLNHTSACCAASAAHLQLLQLAAKGCLLSAVAVALSDNQLGL